MNKNHLKQILRDHKLWLDSNGEQGKQANLTGAILFNANLANANLFNANLAGANLTDANLFNVILTNANLTNANLTGADLTNAILANANLTGANLAGANLFNADLFNTRLEGVKGIKVFKCFYVEFNEKKFKYFFNSIEAKKDMSKRLANKQCSWVEG